MNEMRKLMEVVEEAGIIDSPTVNRFIIKHTSGSYVSNFSFGNNTKMTNAKLFLTLDAAQIHMESFQMDGWQIIPVEVTIKEKRKGLGEDRDEFVSRIDGSFEEKIKEAYLAGHLEGTNVGMDRGTSRSSFGQEETPEEAYEHWKKHGF